MANPDRSTPVLEARGVHMRFGGLNALTEVDLVVEPGATVGLVGPNGAGKTTLFGVLSGLLRPTAGIVLMDGVEVTSQSPQRRAGRGLARTFQRIELFSELTVREHLALAHRTRHHRSRTFADLVGLGRRVDATETAAVEEILDLLELGPIADRVVAGLPLGTGRLVEVGRALANEPTVLLLDEPSSGLDRHETQALSDALVRTCRDRGVAMVLVEHDLDFVLGVAETVTVLDFGTVIAVGTPEEIRRDPKVQAAYLGSDVDAA